MLRLARRCVLTVVAALIPMPALAQDVARSLDQLQRTLKAGQTVVDYCAGAGGKTIALADLVGPKGRVLAWDISPRRLNEAKRRAKQLKLQQVSFPKAVRLDEADLVLVDAPCSGTGTLSREPDQKWKLHHKDIAEYAKKQSAILDEVAAKMRPDATLVYATCSVLRTENEEVVDAFVKAHPLWRCEEAMHVWPHESEGGGFFGARLTQTPPKR